MIQLSDAEATKPMRKRSPRKPVDQASKGNPSPVPKYRDAGKTKVSFYIDAEVAKKLIHKAVDRGVDQSDLANEILGRHVSSMVCYDSRERQAKANCDEPSRPDDQSLTVTEIGTEVAA